MVNLNQVCFKEGGRRADAPCGHGDFKPNVMLKESSEKMSGEYESPKFQRSLAERLESGDLMVTFIDFELGGPNYRGFDISSCFAAVRWKETGWERNSLRIEI